MNTTDKKRVFCLYRVSTLGQVDKDDIPMQKQACEAFAAQQGWEIVDTRSEKGVSGFKTSANKRDAIQDIREAALRGSFDILLVFMFDRLGRIESETPIIVQWFITNGIEVWSVNEGQRKIEQHIDKLYNYLTFWQAEGESLKTSMRVKTRHGQIVQEGHFRGGTPPFGYHLEHQGRFNKKGFPLNELVIDEREAAIVRTVFDKYVNYGYGTLRIANYLADNALYNREGKRFTNCTLQHMLKRETYIGILKSGESRSAILPELQIIPQEQFDRAREIMKGRSADYTQRRVPLNTKGVALLSGNVFCGHCGARLTLTTNGKKYVRKKDGQAVVIPKMRYVCYNKTRHPELCDGQTGYTTKKLDGVIERVLFGLFSQVLEQPKDELIEREFETRLADYNANLIRAKAALKTETEILESLENELIKVIQGTSLLKPEMLNKKHTEAELAVQQKRADAARCQRELEDTKRLLEQIKKQYTDVETWAGIFGVSEIEVKKMITSQIIRAVRVSRDYHIEIDFNISFEQFGIEA